MPKIIGGSLEEHRKQTRRRIFAALGELMDREGFDSISFAEIAQRAGVGRTALYNHFPDKETLVLEYAMDETSRYVEELRKGISPATDPVDAMRRYIDTHLALRRSFHVTPGPELRSMLSPEAGMKMREHVVLVTQVLREILTEGVTNGVFDPQLDVDATIPLINGCLVGRHIPQHEDHPGYDKAVAAITRFILRGLGVADA